MSEQEITKPSVFTVPGRLEKALRPVAGRHRKERVFRKICLAVSLSSMLLLAIILISIFYQGFATLNSTFLSNPPSPTPSEAGFYPAIFGSIWLLSLVAFFSLPLGVATAILLEEFKPRHKASKLFNSFIQANITNLAGVPSVVYGIVGLTAFVSMFQLFGNEGAPTFEWGAQYMDQFYNESDQILLVPIQDVEDPLTEPVSGMSAFTIDGKKVQVNIVGEDDAWPEDEVLAARSLRDYAMSGRISERTWYYVRLPFGRGVLAGALTLMLVILPVVIIASQESLRAVPNSLRDAALGLAARCKSVF